MAGMAVSVVFASVLGCYLLWRGSEFALKELVYENKAFAIDQIEAQTDGVLSVDQVRRWSGAKIGDNLFALDLERVRRDLRMVSLIESVSVERILPRTLRIRVAEREPLAQLSLIRPRPGGGVETATFQLDVEGCVMAPVDSRYYSHPPAQPLDQLPVITGPNGNEVQIGRRIESPQAQAALQLIVAFDHSPMAGLVDLKRIDASCSEVLVVTTAQGSEVTFGLTNLDGQLRRWAEVYEAGQKMGRAIASLDLAVTNNVPLRFLEASVTPVVAPKLPKPPRKKHV